MAKEDEDDVVDVAILPDVALSGDGVLVSSGAVVVTGVALSDAGIPCTVSSLKGRTLQGSGDASSVVSCSVGGMCWRENVLVQKDNILIPGAFGGTDILMVAKRKERQGDRKAICHQKERLSRCMLPTRGQAEHPGNAGASIAERRQSRRLGGSRNGR